MNCAGGETTPRTACSSDYWLSGVGDGSPRIVVPTLPDTRTVGTSNSLCAKAVIRSKRSSGGVSKISNSRSAARRPFSSAGIEGGFI